MTLTWFCRAVRSQWQTVRQLVWPETVQQRTEAEIQRLTRELSRRYIGLIRRKRKIAHLQDRLDQLERQLRQPTLTSLEPLFRACTRLRQRLGDQERKYQQQRQAFLRRKQLRLALVRGEVLVAEDPPSHED